MRAATSGSAAPAALFLILAVVVAAISPVSKGFAVRTALSPDIDRLRRRPAG